MAPAYIEIATDDSADDTTQLSSELLSDNDVEENATNDVKSSPLKRYLNSQKRGYDSGSESDNQSVTSVPKMLDFSKSLLARASQSSMTGIGPKRKKPTDFTFNFGSQIKTKNRESQQPSMSNEYEQISKKNTETIEVPLDTWANKSAPKKLEELCIHNRKISDLENEIRSLIYRKDETRILVVSGPTGSGKSTACKMIANQMMKEKIAQKHRQFIGSAISDSLNERNNYTVEFNILKDSHQGNSSVSYFSEFLDQCKLLTGLHEMCIIIEELPNIFHKETHVDFQRSIKNWLGLSPLYELPPMIICVTEFDIENDLDWSNSTNFTIENTVKVETVFGFNLMQSLGRGWKRIKFNPVAKTFLKKALIRVTNLENIERNKIINSKIDSLSGLGDLRNAINTFEFWYRFQYNGSATIISESLEGKESGLDIFHSIGKVIYGTKHQTEEFEDFCKRHTMKISPDRVSANVVTADNVSSEVTSHIMRFNLCCLENYAAIDPPVCEELCDLMEIFSITDTIIDRSNRKNNANILQNASFYSCFGLRTVCDTLASMKHSGSANYSKKTVFSRDSKLKKKLQSVGTEIREFRYRRELRLFSASNYAHINAVEIVLIDGYYQTQILASFKFRMQMFQKYGSTDKIAIVDRLGGKLSEIGIRAGDDLGSEVEDEVVVTDKKVINKEELQKMEDHYFGVNQGLLVTELETSDCGGEIDSDPIEDSEDEGITVAGPMSGYGHEERVSNPELVRSERKSAATLGDYGVANDAEFSDEDVFSDDSLVLKELF